jgi:hypothetical protein
MNQIRGAPLGLPARRSQAYCSVALFGGLRARLVPDLSIELPELGVARLMQAVGFPW